MQEIINKLAGLINDSRLKHSLATRDTAVELAVRNGVDEERVSLAAILHDCARDLEPEEFLNIAYKEELTINEIEKRNPVLLHGPVGAVIARKEFGVSDLKVLRAISIHTTGAQEMSALDKIIYAADKVEPDRKYPGVDDLRDKAYNNLNEGVLACLDNSIKYSLQKEELLHPYSCYARNSILLEMMQASY